MSIDLHIQLPGDAIHVIIGVLLLFLPSPATHAYEGLRAAWDKRKEAKLAASSNPPAANP